MSISVDIFYNRFSGIVRLTDVLDADVVLGGEHAGTGACGRADGERERRGRPVDHAACHELQDDVAVVIDVALLDVVEETVLLERFLPEADDVVLGLAGGGGQQVGDGLEDGADGLGRDAFFLGLDAECGDQRCELLDVNHNQNSFAILRRKATLIGRCGKRQGKLKGLSWFILFLSTN